MKFDAARLFVFTDESDIGVASSSCHDIASGCNNDVDVVGWCNNGYSIASGCNAHGIANGCM